MIIADAVFLDDAGRSRFQPVCDFKGAAASIDEVLADVSDALIGGDNIERIAFRVMTGNCCLEQNGSQIIVYFIIRTARLQIPAQNTIGLQAVGFRW
jgi:hypothetical protein